MNKRGPKAFREKFRREALRPPETRPVMQVARELGMHPETLRGWRRLARARSDALSERSPTTVPEMEAELRRLRRETSGSARSGKSPKKATAFFTKDAR